MAANLFCQLQAFAHCFLIEGVTHEPVIDLIIYQAVFVAFPLLCWLAIRDAREVAAARR